MRHLAKIHVLVVVAAVLFGTLAANNTHPDAPTRNAGCHEREKAPDRDPVSYDCCQNGHGLALVRAADKGSRDLGIIDSPALSLGQALTFDTTRSPSSADPDKNEPPGRLPLRI